jgi:hypothetical protein
MPESLRNRLPQLFDFAKEHDSPKSTATSTTSTIKIAEPASAAEQRSPEEEQQSAIASQEVTRDAGVSDETWAQLQADILANELAKQQSQKNITSLDEQLNRAITNEKPITQAATALYQKTAKENPKIISAPDDNNDDEQRRLAEQARIRAVQARRARLEAEDKLRKAQEEEERKREREAKAQKKLSPGTWAFA